MDIRQLRYYKEIVDQGSISKAAERLHIAQPPLSQLLKKLEDDFNTELIRRYRQKWEVTESGELLYRYAVQILGQLGTITAG
ncbi:LysR family transcriptional regulator [Jeotgalicoccus halotolerans]|uniref:LysR family transcriptional regulator n=1 Tax=Jeotgalicoccus halotolerans TaxID=157227 RepID=UPI00351552F3